MTGHDIASDAEEPAHRGPAVRTIYPVTRSNSREAVVPGEYAGLESKPIQWRIPMDRRYVVSMLLVLAVGASHPARTQEVQRAEVREGGLVGRFYAVVGASRQTGLLMLTGSGGSYLD